MNKYQLNPLLESEDKNDHNGLKRFGLGIGAYTSGLLGFNTIKDNIDKVTGIETRYHNTASPNVDSVLDQGILGKHASDPYNLTNKVLGDEAKKQGIDDLVYLAKKKSIANGVGKNRAVQGLDYTGGETLKVKIPYDEYLKHQKVKNPELLGSHNFEEYVNKLFKDPSVRSKLAKQVGPSLSPEDKQQFEKFIKSGNLKDLSLLPRSLIKSLIKMNYNMVGKNTDTIKGNISPEFIEGSKHFRNNMMRDNFIKYVKNHPGRFAKGVSGIGLGVAGLGGTGYMVKKAYDMKHNKNKDA